MSGHSAGASAGSSLAGVELLAGKPLLGASWRSVREGRGLLRPNRGRVGKAAMLNRATGQDVLGHSPGTCTEASSPGWALASPAMLQELAGQVLTAGSKSLPNAFQQNLQPDVGFCF